MSFVYIVRRGSGLVLDSGLGLINRDGGLTNARLRKPFTESDILTASLNKMTASVNQFCVAVTYDRLG